MLQKKLEDTEHALGDLEERYRQANATIKEKEYLIANLLRSGEYKMMLLMETSNRVYLCHFPFFLVSYGYILFGKGAVHTIWTSFYH